MLKKLLVMINELVLKLISSLKRFPQALTLALAMVVVLIIINHTTPTGDTLEHIAMVLALGVPLTLCIKMIFERVAVKRLAACGIYIVAAFALIGYYNFLLPDMGMVSISRYIGFTVALYLLFIAVPFVGRKEGFALYVIKLFTGFIVTYFYSLILYAGLSAILFTINTLFSADIPSKVYFDLWLIVAGVFAPAYFFAGIPSYGADFSLEDYPNFLRVLLLYIVMPLLSVYTGILYAYFIKILVTRNWPIGMVSNLVLWYSFVSTGVVFFIYILKEKETWARVFASYLPKLILPLLIMMFVAMGIRINAYGVTENRYLVLTGGIWTTGCMLYFAAKKNPTKIAIVLSAAIIAALVVTGPWSCYSVSKYSQNARFEKILTRNNMLINGKIVPNQGISTADKVTISSVVQYFQTDHHLKELKYLPQDFGVNQMQDTFGFGMTFSDENLSFSHNLQEAGELQDIRGYDYYLPTQIPGRTLVNQGTLGVSYDNASRALKISKDGQVIYQKDVSEAAYTIHKAHTGENILTNKDMTFVDENEKVKIMLLFRNINGTESGGNGRPGIEWLDFSLFITLK
ncbi:MAG TPA: DUF4153 domain-containing protein [Syntrophomonadaceae bacterium]|nr:DUF4153 domain-containing protein [Syntrophomonadaceae bacterium]